MKYDAIVVASGIGSRAKLGYNKVLYQMKNGKTVLENACQLFLMDEDCEKVIVVSDAKNFEHPKLIWTSGGLKRSDSVYQGLILAESEYVLIHDGARPFLSQRALAALKEEVIRTDAAILATKCKDTVKRVIAGKIIETINREEIYLAQTPQAFRRELLLSANRNLSADANVTDDASIMELAGHEVSIVENLDSNPKLTLKADFEEI